VLVILSLDQSKRSDLNSCIHMDEALDVVQRERQTETSLKEAFNFFFFFFQVFQISSLLQLLNTAAGRKIQGQYCDPPFVSDAFAFCPGC